MSLYLTRFSPFPRPVTAEHSRAGLTRQLGYLGQPPTTRDLVNSHAAPFPWPAQWSMPGAGVDWSSVNQLPGPFVSPDLSPHLYPPRNWENLDLFDWVPVPAIGSITPVFQFKVPIGRNGVINKISNDFVGGGWIAGTGDLIWRILVDGASPPGTNTYHNIKGSIGSQAQPVGISGFRIFENQLLSVVVFNNPGGVNGGVIVSGQQAGARLMGHLFPRDMEYKDTWV